MASASSPTQTLPSRSATVATTASEVAVPDSHKTSTPGLLEGRLLAWKDVVVSLEEYVTAFEKIHKAQAKEYERALKVISQPLKHADNFDHGTGGITGFFENMRSNTQALINTNSETEKSLKGSVLPAIERLLKEIRAKLKDLAHGTIKTAKEVEKARGATQKHIELLGQQAASFESAGGKLQSSEDPYVVYRGVVHRLHKQVIEENNQHNDLVSLQTNFESFESHIIRTIQQTMEVFTQLAGGQGERVRILHLDMLSSAQRVPLNFEWAGFVQRNKDSLASASTPPRVVEAITFPNMDHRSTKPVIEGSLERKSRNKLSWGFQTAYYVVTPSKFLHEFKDDDNSRHDPKPELSIYLPDAMIGTPVQDKFSVKGKDRSKTVSSKLLAGSTELSFKAHSAADAERWFEVLRSVAGASGTGSGTGTGPSSEPSSPTSPTSPTAAAAATGVAAGTAASEKVGATKATEATGATKAAEAAAADDKGHEAGVVDANIKKTATLGDDDLKDTQVPVEIPEEKPKPVSAPDSTAEKPKPVPAPDSTAEKPKVGV